MHNIYIDTVQVSQVVLPEDTKRTRKQEEQEEKRKKHHNTEKMSHSGTLHQRTMGKLQVHL